jgi:pheromone shutdown protein TraB
MVTIVGTCHVLNLKEKVKSLIKLHRPHAVCVELDEKRLERLKGKTPHPTGFLSLIQKLLAMRYGTQPGNDMLGAVEGANEIEASLFLIDKDIESLVDKFQEAFMRELLNPLELIRKLLVSTGVSWNYLSLLHSRDIIEAFVYEFSRNPDKYRSQFEALFPYLTKILLDEREKHMAEKVRHIQNSYENILVVVGAGHVTGLERLLFDLEVKPINLLT